MKLYNKETKELFGCISFAKSVNQIIDKRDNDIRIRRVKKLYLLPLKSNVWSSDVKKRLLYRSETMYLFLIWEIRIMHVRQIDLEFIK